MASHELTKHPGDPGMGKETHGSRSGFGNGRDSLKDDKPHEGTGHAKPEQRHDNLTHLDQTQETLDERAMDAADEAGSALLEHDKVTRRPKRN